MVLIFVQITGFSFDGLKEKLPIQLKIHEQIYKTTIGQQTYHEKFFFKFFKFFKTLFSIKKNPELLISILEDQEVIATTNIKLTEILKVNHLGFVYFF
jgi:hypothetical protein